MMDKMYRVGNPLEIPSYVHILRWKESDVQVGDVLVQGEERLFYEDDIFEPPSNLPLDRLQDWIKRGFLVEMNYG